MACTSSRCLLILVVIFGVNITDSCDLIDSVPILGGYTTMPTGELLHQGVTYTPKHLFHSTKTLRRGTEVSVERHLRGCLCQIVQCIRLCCPVGYVADDENCTMRENYHVNVDVFDNNGQFENVDLVEHPDFKHRIASSRPCNQMYDLEPVEFSSDNFTLLRSGEVNLWMQNKTLEHTKYCIKVKNHENLTDVLNILVSACFEPDEIDDWLYPISMLCSVPFLIATFLVHALIPELHGNNHGKSLMFYTMGLTVGYTTLAYTMLSHSVEALPCTALGYITYFSLLFSFFWSNVMCIDIWLTFRGIRRVAIASKLKNKFINYTLYACLTPLSLLLLTILIDHEVIYLPVEWRPRIGFNRCFLATGRYVELFYLYIPMACLLGANLVLFVLTALRIRKVRNAAASTTDSQRHSRLNDDTDRFILYVRLFIVMGITWTAEVVAWAFQSDKDNLKWVFFFTDICNCIQGIIIFFLFVWKPKVRELICSRFGHLAISQSASTQEST